MKEVSTKAFELFVKPLAAKGVGIEALVAGTGVPASVLLDKRERVSWSEFCAIMKNVRPHFSDEEYVGVGRSFFRSPGLRFAFVIARLLLTPMGFYRFQNKPRHGAGNQLFTCIIPKHRDISEHECEVDLTVPDGFEVCWDFWIVTIGTFSEMPRLLGYPAAKVDLQRIPNGGRFHIVVPKRTPFLTRIRRALAWPFTARAAARELREAHESLIDRYAELEDARSKIDRQATQLHTAHVVNELVQRDLDLARTLETIVTALVEEAGFPWAEIVTTDGQRAQYGDTDHEAPLVRAMVSHGGHAIGELHVAPKRGADLVERNALLDFIVPSLSMAVENATYRTNLERLVEERTAELREAQGARERFFAHISHEIRTPLTIITLAASDVVHRGRDVLDARSKRNLDAVNDAARKLVRLVDELLLLAAGQEGKLTTHPEPTNLVELMKNIEAAWQLAAEPAGLSMHLRVPESLVANVDPVAFERVLTNLVSNAVKYTPRGGRIDLELASEPEGVRISVFDTGPGISPELAGRLFGRFERAHGVTAHGTGLGLALSRQLVNAHGATIDAHARPGGGCELRVMLPRELVLRDTIARQPTQLRLVDQVPKPAPTSAEHVAVRAALGTVLLAEDDVRLAELVASGLSTNYTVVVAHDGLTALELARKHHPHLLITDVDMPGLDGMELARRFRELTGDRLAPIIILSAMLDRGTRVAGLEAGAIDYITKPFDPLELRARVDAQFRARDLAVRLHRAEQVSSLGILTSGLAHELRNPANAIVNAVEPLMARLPPAVKEPGSPVAELADIIKQCADQIRHLSKQLLGVRNEGMDLEVREAALAEVVQRSLLLAHNRLVGVELRNQIGEVVLKCAPPLLTQALTNLLENAADAAGPGGWVEISARTDAKATVTIEVCDSGPGVPQHLRERVFEPFFTTKAASRGTGLGLSLAREIVHRHAGTLEIHDRAAPASGSAFVIRLPGVCLPATSAGAL